jgi:2'-5' RNA ligase
MTKPQQSYRSFIGIFPPKEILTELVRIQDDLKKEPSPIRWEPPEKLHITMKFLGDLTSQQLKELCRHLSDALKNFPSFEITLTQAGCFPPKKSPRVFWVGSQQNANAALVKCFQAIESACAALGFAKDEHPFHPHITLGRTKGIVSTGPPNSGEVFNLLKTLESITFEPLKFRCVEIAVMKSTLTQRGSTYSNLTKFPLPL